MKHDSTRAFNRIIIIWNRLREGETLSIKDLAEEFDVSTKTIQRDFNEKLADKLPIEKIGRKWKVKDGFSIDKDLSFNENLVLDILKSISKKVGNDFSTNVDTLFSKIQNSHNNSIYSKLTIEDLSNQTDLIQKLDIAITNLKEVKFYFNNKERIVEPYKITNFDGSWYLYANEYENSKLKTYYIKDIKKLEILDKKFKIDLSVLRKLDLAINVWFEAHEKPFEVKLLLLKDIAKYITERKPLNSTQTKLREYDDGTIEIMLMATSKKEILHEIKKYQPSVLIIEPEELAHEMCEINENYYKKQKELLF